MHVFFSGIGGAGVGPLALIAKQAGFEVSGSDKQDSQYIGYLRDHGVADVHIGQTEVAIAKVHAEKQIDWFVYSSALAIENPNHPELVFVEANGIRHSKRDEFLNHLLDTKGKKMIAIAGTHGKTTTTAMMIWLFKQLNLPVSYSVGAKLSFGEMGEFDEKSEYFIYECDEFDRNFLAFKPYMSLITGVAWDHHDIFPTQENYDQAFLQFFDQSENLILWQEDSLRLDVKTRPGVTTLSKAHPITEIIKLVGAVNRQNACQVIEAVHELTNEPVQKLIGLLEQFPGLSRRFEKLAESLYTDYAHTAEKIAGALGVARETSQNVVVVYEGLHNRRQHFMLDRGQFGGLFNGVKKLYWVPSYLAREDPDLETLSPAQLIAKTGYGFAEPAELDESLKQNIKSNFYKEFL